MCVGTENTWWQRALVVCILLRKLSFFFAEMQRASVSECLQFDDREDDDEGRARLELSALSLGLFA